ncbi:hypothetical protein [Tahibacter amnicola]|uniref:Teneurin-like YD-shell domain-containing protein n=1 Tax=Tahibacter amnicola TaxID=2976241 RepID=A0ABY6BK99_9GAMM|nr:hypothetical protein [Tahibacter amnicola]UXI68217.1 hypothetical protein N4264_00765 [Tahibacter amnicola]
MTFNYTSPWTHDVASVGLPDGNQIQYTVTNGLLEAVTYPGVGNVTYQYYPDARPLQSREALLQRVLRNGVEHTYYEYNQSYAYEGEVRKLATKSRLSGAYADYGFSYTIGQSATSTAITTPSGVTTTMRGVIRDGRLLLAERADNCTSCSLGGSAQALIYDSSAVPVGSVDFRGKTVTRTVNARGLEESRKEAATSSTDSNGCPVGTTFSATTFTGECPTGSCRSTTPFLGSRHASRFGFDNEYFSCKSTPNLTGSPAMRTTTTQWHATLPVPLEKSVYNAANQRKSLTRMAYDGSTGRLLAKCEIDPTDPLAGTNYDCSSAPANSAKVQRWAYAYCTAADASAPNSTCPLVGLRKTVNGPRDPSEAGMAGGDDVTSYTYYGTADQTNCGMLVGPCHRKGDLWKVTDAMGRTTEFVAYDKAGRVVRSKDGNGTLTDYVYNERGWLKSRTVRHHATGLISPSLDATTSFGHDAAGNITRVTQPDGAYLDYIYDTAYRLTDIVDILGGRIHYTLDAAGNRTGEDTFDTGNSLKRTVARQFDQLNRLKKSLNASNVPTFNSEVFNDGLVNGYDVNGNLVRYVDGLGSQTFRSYDPLNRLVTTVQDYSGTDPETSNATSVYGYDVLDNLTSVTDPDVLTTTYVYDGLNKLVEINSPDTGYSSYGYDKAGNRIRRTDNRGITTNFTYDRLNRLTGISYANSSLNVTYVYDQPDAVTGCLASFPIGRLTRMTDQSGTTTYCYDRRGNVLKRVQAVASSTLTIGRTYTKSDRVLTMTYPSGGVATYTRDAAGRAVGLTWKATATSNPVTVVSSVTYYPFGPPHVLTFGNGRTLSKTYDQDYAIDKIVSSGPGGLVLDFSLDSMGNVQEASDAIAQVTPDRKFVYDKHSRLSKVTDGFGAMVEDYGYNKTGDRVSKQFVGQPAQSYTYLPGTHRLQAVGGVSRVLTPDPWTRWNVSHHRGRRHGKEERIGCCEARRDSPGVVAQGGAGDATGAAVWD